MECIVLSPDLRHCAKFQFVGTTGSGHTFQLLDSTHTDKQSERRVVEVKKTIQLKIADTTTVKIYWKYEFETPKRPF